MTHEANVFRGKLDGKGRVTVPKDIREQWQVSSGDRVEVAVVGVVSGGYTCDECGNEHDLADVAIFRRGAADERVCCTECLSAADRIV